MRSIFLLAVASAATGFALGQGAVFNSPLDSDHDGISDAVENSLLTAFEPHFFVSSRDCSALPARFVPGKAEPTVAAEDGTIYGQVRPVAGE